MRVLTRPRLGRTALALVVDWSVIAFAAGASHWLANPAAYLVAVLIIAGRQHSLLVFMHEAAHGTLARNKRLNESFGQIACAWPLLLDVRSFRHVHLKHHRFDCAPGDPDFEFRAGEEWLFPRSLSSVVRPLILDLLGFGAFSVFRYLKYYGQAPRDPRRAIVVIKVLFYAMALALVAWWGGWLQVFAYWIVPMLTALKAFVRWREIAEHYGIRASTAVVRTRTTRTSWIERITLAPRNINFHAEHHLFPGVPWYSLPSLHAALIRLPAYAARAPVTRSYVAVLRDCSTEPVALPIATGSADAE